jgi:RNA polymerase sigma factor for flagellar operon FliA
MGDSTDAKLIEQHLPLVRHIVFQVAVHFPRHVDRQELAHAGALGLVEAAQRYDESRGVPFDRFAAQRIRGAILDAVRAADWAPRSVRNLARKLESAEQRLATELGRVPSLAECATELGVSTDELTKLQDRMFRSVVLALEHEVNDETDEDLTLVDVLCDRTAVEGQTSLELARFLGVTESRISQLRSEALAMLREGIEAQYEANRPAPEDVSGRVARRKATYAEAISEASQWKTRLTEPDRAAVPA